MLLQGEAEPLQQGAFLMLLRVKEETAEELAGFVQACRQSMRAPGAIHADLDWSSYAGKRHQHPWFILSMLLLASAGYRVFVHGSDGHTPGRLYTEDAMRQLGLPVAADWQEVSTQLDEHQLSYLPLRHFCYPLHEMMQLRHLLGLRSPVNTLARMINPLGADASVQSIFHPAYAVLHQQTDHILAQPRALVFKGDSGEVEVKPQADTQLFLLSDGDQVEWSLPRSLRQRVGNVEFPCVEPLREFWIGNTDDDYGLDATLATAVAALLVLAPTLTPATAQRRAAELWHNRDRRRLS